MSIKLRLIIMNFLQYAVWGSWLISLGAYLGGGLHFSGLQIGSFFATMGIASLFMQLERWSIYIIGPIRGLFLAVTHW